MSKHCGKCKYKSYVVEDTFNFFSMTKIPLKLDYCNKYKTKLRREAVPKYRLLKCKECTK